VQQLPIEERNGYLFAAAALNVAGVAEEVAEHVAIEREAQAAANRRRPLLIRMSDVLPEAVRWLWPGRVAIGKLNLIAGDPGVSKSTLTIEMTARITRGDIWPACGDHRLPAANVLMLSAEDGLADTIQPRLRLAGADLRRVTILRGIQCGKNEEQFDLSDIPMLEDAIVQVRPLLLTIDPVSAYTNARVDTKQDAQVRRMLKPLADLAEKHQCAVVGVTHLNKAELKNVLHRVPGSIAYVGAARSVLAVVADPGEQGSCVVGRIKGNLGRRPGDVGYRLVSEGADHARIEWLESTPIRGIEALLGSAGESEEDREEQVDAVEFLREALGAGNRVEFKKLLREAVQMGISERTLKRAKKALGVQSQWVGRESYWFLG
jgi:hypothetical protein